jgi:hypothetical protein
LAFALMMGVSLLGRPTPWARTAMLRLHLDDDRRPADARSTPTTR